MQFQLDDFTLNYETHGQGKPVLMLHGLPLDHRAMVGAMEPVFSQRDGWKRFYLDLPGMGQSKGGAWINSNDDVVNVLCQFIDSVLPKQPFLLMGFSYGGYIARGLLHHLHERVDGMMLLVPSVPDKRKDRILPPHRTIAPNPSGLAKLPSEMGQFLAGMLVVQDDEILERTGKEIAVGMQMADEELLGRIAQNHSFSFVVDDLPTPYDKPVLILTGKHDSVTGWQDANNLLQYYPRATFAVLDRAGHGFHLEQPTLFNQFIHEWLDRIEEQVACA